MTTQKNTITTLWLDIGGVLLTNGWDHLSRQKAAAVFGFNYEDFNERHKLYYNLHETGKLSIDAYLDKTLFYKSQQFSKEAFKAFMREQSTPYEETLAFFKNLKSAYGLRVAALSNEGHYLSEHRIKTFNLKALIDDFFISCFIGFQKPDPRFYQTALDLMQIENEEILYVDDREYLVKAACTLGFNGVIYEQTEKFRNDVIKLF